MSSFILFLEVAVLCNVFEKHYTHIFRRDF